MKHIIHTIRNRPHHVRMIIALVCAGFVTLLIGVGWVATSTMKNDVVYKKTKEAPKPIDALAGSIKSVWQEGTKKQVDVQIINTSDSSYDESNPYQQ